MCCWKQPRLACQRDGQLDRRHRPGCTCWRLIAEIHAGSEQTDKQADGGGVVFAGGQAGGRGAGVSCWLNRLGAGRVQSLIWEHGSEQQIAAVTSDAVTCGA